MKKSIYRKPSVDGIPVENEGVMAASVDNIAPGKRYDIGHDLPQGALPARGASPLLKLTRQLLPLLALGLAVASCGGEETPTDKPAEKGTFNLVVTATTASPATTRTVYTAGEETVGEVTADKLDVTWDSDVPMREMLLAIGHNGGSNLYRGKLLGSETPTNEGKSLTFTPFFNSNNEGTGALDPEASSDGSFNFIYVNSDNQSDVLTNEMFTSKTLGSFKFDLSGQTCDLNAPTANLKRYDLMYTTSAVTPTTTGDATTASIQLTHPTAVVYFNFTLPAGAPVINRISLSASSAIFNPGISLDYASDGKVTVTPDGTSTSTLTLSVSNDDEPNTSLREIKAYMMVPAITKFEDQLLKVSAYYDSDDDDNTPETVNPVYSYLYSLYDSTYDNDALEAGKCYTFGYDKTLEEDRWAGSNIYVGSDGKPTFNPPYDMSGVQYQGLFYKWGSLLGVSPILTDGKWTVYDTAGNSTPKTAWSGIDDFNTSAGGNITETDDICTALNENYRMPTKQDFEALEAGVKPGAWTAVSGVEAAGTTTINSGLILQNMTFFPAAGLIDSDGVILSIGRYMNYWSSVTEGGNYPAFFERYNGTGASLVPYGSPEYAYSIRCIKKAAGELSGD